MPSTDTDIDLEEPVDDGAIEAKLQSPLTIFRSVAERLRRPDMQFSKDQVNGLFSHLRGAVNEVLEFAISQLNSSLEQAASALEAVEDEVGTDSGSDLTSEILEEYEAAREEVETGLRMVQKMIDSAVSFEELEAHAGSLTLAEAHLEEGLARIEQALLRADDPALAMTAAEVRPEVPLATDALGDALDALARHFEDGQDAHIEEALGLLERAHILLEQALGLEFEGDSAAPPEPSDES